MTSPPSRSESITFYGDLADAKALLAEVSDGLPDVATTVTVDDLATRFRLKSGAEFLLTVGASSDRAAAAAGAFTITATLLSACDDGWCDVAAAVRRAGFTNHEIAEIQRTMPLTSGLPDRIGAQPLRGYHAIFTIHHMRDFLVMVQSAVALGLNPQHITVIDKEYEYRYRDRVDGHLVNSIGVTVGRYTDILTVIGSHLERAKTARQRTIVLDDGGYVYPLLHKHFRHDLQEFVGIIEQTRSGIWKLRPFSEIPVPIFSVAESRVKATIENYGVADANVRNVWRLLPDEKFEGRRALVIGLGNVGGPLLDILRDRRMIVMAFDTDIVSLVGARERGFDTSRELASLLGREPMIIFGCSGGIAAGRHALGRNDFEALRGDCYIVSTTSRDYEFDVAALKDLAVRVEWTSPAGPTYSLASGARVTVIAQGLPANFYGAESMPNRYSDLVLAGMLTGACTLTQPDCDFVPGHNVALTDRALEGSGLLEEYYDAYYGEAS